MPASQFNFSSPGVEIHELDQSIVPGKVEQKGPIIIGLSERGPAFQPIKVSSFDEFSQIFGNTVPGGQSGDVWRDGNYTAPLYAPYAMESWLKNGETATFIKLLGSEHSEATIGGVSGWKAGTLTADSNGGAYGLFLFPSGAVETSTGSLTAVFYCSDSYAQLSSSRGQSSAKFFESDANGNFTLVIKSGSAEERKLFQ
jgi:hypothetical protein